MQTPNNPQTEPTSNERAPIAPIAPYRSSARRARVAIWLLAVSTVVAGFILAVDAYGIVIVQKAAAGTLTFAEANDFAALAAEIGAASLVVFLVTAVAFLAWLSRAIDNVPALGAGQPSASPRWAIAWWFIPFANLGMPYEVVRELRARMRGDKLGGHPPLLLAWWFTFVGSAALEVGAAQVPGETLGQISASLLVAAVASALTVCAGVLAIMVVRGIERAARARVAVAQSGVPIPTSGSEGDEDPRGRKTGWRMRASWVGFLAITASMAVAIAVPVLATLPRDTSARTVATATPTDQSTAQASAEPTGDVLTGLHQAPGLEAGLPESVAGQPLRRWSVRGEGYFVTVLGMDVDALAQVEADLAQDGLTLNDVALAFAGRANEDDPPYLVASIQFRGIAADTLPDSIVLDHPDAGTFAAVSFGGKSVRRGMAEMVEQGEHARGIPYLYDSGDIRYVVVTDDEDWAADALRQLP